MPRKREVMTLSLDPEVKANLEAIALELGYTWGERGNVSRMIEAIGKGDAKVSKSPNHEIKIDRSLILAEKALSTALEAIAQYRRQSQ